MYNTEMFTQVVEYQKTLFDNSFSMMATLQDQGHQLMDKAFETTMLPQPCAFDQALPPPQSLNRGLIH